MPRAGRPGTRRIPARVIRRAAAVRLILMDVDGTLTDGRMLHFADTAGNPVELKATSSKDGIALIWASMSGLRTGVISARRSAGVEIRARMLRMSYVIQDAQDKAPAMEGVLREAGVSGREAAYIGDDLHDIPAMRLAGLAVAVGDAVPEAKAAAHWVTRSPGGRGAVREAVELILRARGLWKGILDRYGAVDLG